MTTIDTTLPVPSPDMGPGRRPGQDGRTIADAARDLRIAGVAPDLAALLEDLAFTLDVGVDTPDGHPHGRVDLTIDGNVPRAMDQLRALATSNLHVALAERLGCSPQRTDAQLLEHVGRLRARANGDAR